MMEKVLAKIASELNSANILWGIGASMVLHQYSLVKNPTDIDILVSVSDIDEADKILSGMGIKIHNEKNSSVYSTEYFREYIVDDINIDVMAGFKINLPDKKTFEYPFDAESVPLTFTIGNMPVPSTTLEDWYVLYQLIPNREAKAKLILNYFNEHGIEYPPLVERMINNGSVPTEIKQKLQKLLDCDSYRKLIEAQDTFLVDVRTPEEYAEGYVEGSINIPLDSVEDNLDKFEGKKNIVVFCHSGKRSAIAKKILQSNGFSNIINGGSWTDVNNFRQRT
ncbi:MAG: rhodanese-like domain-containing protein [Dysgonomonas sp.]